MRHENDIIGEFAHLCFMRGADSVVKRRDGGVVRVSVYWGTLADQRTSSVDISIYTVCRMTQSPNASGFVEEVFAELKQARSTERDGHVVRRIPEVAQTT